MEELIEKTLIDNYNKYYRLAFKFVHNEHDAMDIVQEGACKAIIKSDLLKEKAYADTWIYRIMVTLKLITLETQASGYQQYHFYHIDKATGKVMTLKDLFKKDFNYVSVISESIKSQMRSQMAEDENKMYFLDSDLPENDFKEIAPDQNFYFNNNGGLVIVFNEYEAAPGYMGNPEFVIPKEIWEMGKIKN